MISRHILRAFSFSILWLMLFNLFSIFAMQSPFLSYYYEHHPLSQDNPFLYLRHGWIMLSRIFCEPFAGFFGSYFSVAMTVLFAPILEELQFRGLIFWYLKRHPHSKWFAAFTTSVLFAAMHNRAFAYQFLIFVLGMILAWTAIKTRRFYPSMIVHALYNLHITIMTMIYGADMMNYSLTFSD